MNFTWESFKSSLPPFQVRYWADGKGLGIVRIPQAEERYYNTSEYFYCCVCDTVWGMKEYPNRPWQPQHITCRNCRDERSEYCVPGSMLGALTTFEDLMALPEAMIRREFEVHLADYDREHQNEEAEGEGKVRPSPPNPGAEGNQQPQDAGEQ